MLSVCLEKALVGKGTNISICHYGKGMNMDLIYDKMIKRLTELVKNTMMLRDFECGAKPFVGKIMSKSWEK